MYGDIRNTRLYKKVKASLVEATKDWMKVRRGKFSINKIEAWKVSVQKVHDEYLELVDKDKNKLSEIQIAMGDYRNNLFKGPELTGKVIDDGIRVPYMLSAGSYLHPKINESGNLELPLQKEEWLKPNEIVKIDLGIKFGIPKG
jgi:hypothetical protein